MVVEAQSARTRAAREATKWMILLQEEPDDRDLHRRFREWRDSSPVNAAAWAATEHMSKLSAAVLPDYVEEWHRTEVRRPARMLARRRWLLPAVATAMVACVVALAVPVVLLQFRSDYATGTTELRTVALPDGSEVILAPDTSIALSFAAHERRVRLLAGEAFFAVKADAGRPFKVEARNVETTVLGTRFDVLMDGDGVVVAVEEGSVSVGVLAATGAITRLQPGQSVRMTRAGAPHAGSKPPQLTASWRHGQLYLQDQTLREAIDRLSGYFSGSIVLADAALGDLQVTGAYNLRDPEEALRGMAEVLGFKVRRITPWLLVVSGF
jgi:transmembrane sensor